ncbi:MAG TPA: hypothetical protein VFH39_02725 [Candidatus Saccharimonadales bacterium]|nr:hypothetical protein [Candidatus Saccharimonadales bacterium]
MAERSHGSSSMPENYDPFTDLSLVWKEPKGTAERSIDLLALRMFEAADVEEGVCDTDRGLELKLPDEPTPRFAPEDLTTLGVEWVTIVDNLPKPDQK